VKKHSDIQSIGESSKEEAGRLRWFQGCHCSCSMPKSLHSPWPGSVMRPLFPTSASLTTAWRSESPSRPPPRNVDHLSLTSDRSLPTASHHHFAFTLH
jgi:hypothetical protein